MRTIALIVGTLLLVFALATCAGAAEAPNGQLDGAASVAAVAATETPAAVNQRADASSAVDSAAADAVTLTQLSAPHESAAAWQDAPVTFIRLEGNSIVVEGDGVAIDGSTATITAAGSYELSGALADGQIIVDTKDKETVYLILNGVDLRSSVNAPLAVLDAKTAVIVLAEGAQNFIEDSASYVFANPEDDEPNAALFAKSDLTITGAGALTVRGNYNDGIASKDGLVIESGSITVSAVDDGIRGKDYLVVKNGSLTIDAGGDGLKADNEDDATLGYILVEAGEIRVTAGGDALTAQSNVLVRGGDFTLTAGGGGTTRIDDSHSAKGVKAAVGIQIDGGAFAIDAADDGVHANGGIVINGGVFEIATGDDGMHADATLTINNGDIRITRSYEGLESAVITINGGNIYIVANDDGVNVAGGVDGSGTMRGAPGGGRPNRQQPGAPPAGMPGQDAFTYTGNQYLYINGGYLVVDAAGDGIDVNGAVEMTGGVVIVHGPAANMNAALDYDAGFTISGGLLAAVGSAGMAQAPGGASTQNSLLINFNAVQQAGTLVHIQDSQGAAILTFAPNKAHQSLAFSSPQLVAGETYTVYLGGSSSGEAVDGLVQNGVYLPGMEYTTFTVESIVTIIGGRMR